MRDRSRQGVRVGRRRLALAAAALAGLILASQFGNARPAGAAVGDCGEIVRPLANGDPVTTEGAVSLLVDGLGAFGSDRHPTGPLFNPPGSWAGAGGATNASHLYLSTAGQFLVNDETTQVCVDSESPLVTSATIGPLEVQVAQTLAAPNLGASTLTQTYTFTNPGTDPVAFTVVRHVDPTLRFDGTDLDGAGADGPAGGTLVEWDTVSAVNPRAFVAITGDLAGNATPDAWTIRPFPYAAEIIVNDGIPGGHDGTVENDGNGDHAADLPADYTLSQQWSGSVDPNTSVTFTTRTTFNAENRLPDANADSAATAFGASVDVNVRGNDTEPDGDPITIVSVTPSSNGSTAINPDGSVRYTPSPGFSGADSFSYQVSDGRGGSDTAAVAVDVAAVNRAQLSVAKTGDGTVSSVPAGINCGAICAADFDEGSTALLVPSAAPGWTFGGWSGACSGLGACSVLMNAAKNVTAAFLPPAPVGGQTANVEPTRGVVLVKEPGSNVFVPLLGADQIPIGSQLDTTAGAVEITLRRGAARETSEFYDGLFTLLQPNANAIGELRLGGGDFLRCLTPLADRRPVRRLWGSGRGRFRTRGRYSSATVRGTKWVTEDACGGTLTKVDEGSVTVYDVVRRVNVVVTAGRSYFAEPLPRGLRSAGCTIVGTSGRDVLRGTRRRDVICGLNGNDVLHGLGGRDVLIAGEGNDRLFGGAADDALHGGAGNDVLDGGLGHDVLDGGAGSDLMLALDGGRGNDKIVGGPGRDRCRTDWIRICP
jgi:Ca2+-binding RTX toxin-like protein